MPPTIVDRAYQLAFRLAFPLMCLAWRLTKPAHTGTQIAIWVDGRVMCVWQSYRDVWVFPGGGVKRGEAPLDAARRELLEELNLRAGPDQPVFVYKEFGIWDYRRDTVWFYEMHPERAPDIRVDNREILSAEFIDPTVLAGLPLAGPVAAYLAWKSGVAWKSGAAGTSSAG